MKHCILLLSVIALLLGMTACSEEPRDFTYYDEGEYKGTVDPLLSKNVHDELNRRFMQVQTDR